MRPIRAASGINTAALALLLVLTASNTDTQPLLRLLDLVGLAALMTGNALVFWRAQSEPQPPPDLIIIESPRPEPELAEPEPEPPPAPFGFPRLAKHTRLKPGDNDDFAPD